MQVGDKVEYTGELMMLSPQKLGLQGTITKVIPNHYSHYLRKHIMFIKVRFEDRNNEVGVFADNVRVILTTPTWEI